MQVVPLKRKARRVVMMREIDQITTLTRNTTTITRRITLTMGRVTTWMILVMEVEVMEAVRCLSTTSSKRH